MSWRSRRLLAFEGKLACRGACLAGLIQAAIAREGAPGRTKVDAAPHRHRAPLGLILLAQGWITHPQLQHALEAQRVLHGGKIGDLLVAECGLGEERVTRGLSVQWNCPVLTTDGFSPQSMAMVLPRFFIKDYGMLPLRVAGNRILYLGFRDRLDASLAFATERMSGLRIESGVLAEGRTSRLRGGGCWSASFPRPTARRCRMAMPWRRGLRRLWSSGRGLRRSWCGCTSITGCACGRRQAPGSLWAAQRCGWRM